MHQLEIEYFFPLTEQINLDLDFTQCEEYHKQKLQQMWSSGQVLVAGGGIGSTTWANIEPTLQFKPDPKAVGHWAIGKDIKVWREHRPNWLHQKMTKVFFGWEWNDR